MHELVTGTDYRPLPNSPAAPLAIRVIDTAREFFALRNEWNAVAAASSASAFQSYEWLSGWWKHFGNHPDCSLHVLLFLRDGRIAGIAPLFVESTKIGGREIHRELKLMGGGTRHRLSPCMPENYGPSDYLDIMATPEEQHRVAEAFVRYLDEHRKLFDRMEFSNIPEQGLMMTMVLPLLNRGTLPFHAERSVVCPRLTVPPSMEEYIARRDAGVRHRIHQARKASIDGKVFTIETITTEEEFEPFYRDLVALHQERWNRLGYPGLFSNPWFEEFQHETALQFLRSGRLWCKAARSNGNTVAARMAFRFNDCYYDYLSGFDDKASAAKRRPGLALLLSMIEDAIRERMSVVDFLRGAEPYKFELTGETSSNWDITIDGPKTTDFAGTVLFPMVWIFRNVAHRIASEGTLLRLQSRRNGMMLALPRYIAFRWSRISENRNNSIPAPVGPLSSAQPGSQTEAVR